MGGNKYSKKIYLIKFTSQRCVRIIITRRLLVVRFVKFLINLNKFNILKYKKSRLEIIYQ